MKKFPDLDTNVKKTFQKLNTPAKIQDFLNFIPMRFDFRGPIVRSPIAALEFGQLSCMEGALLAYVILKYHKHDAYLLDLKVASNNQKDVDHVLTIFRINKKWGALSKTNHAVLRYREPVYDSPREIVMSCFHEYFTHDGKKNLRSFSKPFDLFKRFGLDFIDSHEDLYEIACELDKSPHEAILTPKLARNLRLAEPIEIAAGKILEWDKNRKIF